MRLCTCDRENRSWQLKLEQALKANRYYNQPILIEFDDAKNARNVVERDLSFAQANEFDFSTAIVVTDDRKPYLEVRYVALGVLGARVHVLCFTPVEGGIRVISFCKANSRKIKTDEQTHTTD